MIMGLWVAMSVVGINPMSHYANSQAPSQNHFQMANFWMEIYLFVFLTF